MKTTKRLFSITLMFVLSIPIMLAQTYEWEKAPEPSEIIIETISFDVPAGERCTDPNFPRDNRTTKSETECYKELLNYAKREYSDKYPEFKLRNVVISEFKEVEVRLGDRHIHTVRIYDTVGSLVVKKEDLPLPKALRNALQNVREGSRVAIDQIKIEESEDKEVIQDLVVEYLLDKGYRVVAKGYLETLYEEQQAQKSGIYNDRTTVKENNFSAVGFYISIRKNKTNTYVQVINVSTGEYEGVSDMSESQDKLTQNLSQAVNRGLGNVNEGSRIAIDQISVLSNINKEELKQRIIKVLLDKGYKVIAKDYLDKLYEDQKGQQSGIYNEKTIVQENNFSAVGYYLNAKLTDNMLRMQIVNVSTGEYEGNVTIKLSE